MRWLLIGDTRSVHMRRLGSQLAAHGVEVHAAGPVPLDGIPVSSHVLPTDRRGGISLPAAVRAIRRLVRTTDPDVVNGHYLTSYGLLAAMSGARTVVQTAWGSDLLVTAQRPAYRPMTTWILRRASLVTADSGDLLAAASELAPHVATHRFVFGPPEAAWQEPGRRREPLVVSIRNHEPLYRVETILRAWPAVHERLPRHRLIVLGQGSLTSDLRRMAPPGVEITGSLPHHEVGSLLARSDVVVSVPTSDGTSASVLEAMAARCAVVASDLPSNREWVPAELLVPEPLSDATLADRVTIAAGVECTLDRGVALERQVDKLVARVAELFRS